MGRAARRRARSGGRELSRSCLKSLYACRHVLVGQQWRDRLGQVGGGEMRRRQLVASLLPGEASALLGIVEVD